MNITGTIKVIRDIQQISATFSKREFVVVTSDQYPQEIQLELHQDKTDIIDAYTEGQEVICDINIRGKMWTNPQGEDKYFNTLLCWKIQPANSPSQAGDSAQYNPPVTNTNPKEYPQANTSNSFVDDFKEEEHDDLPF